jgi:hypothetical protein
VQIQIGFQFISFLLDRACGTWLYFEKLFPSLDANSIISFVINLLAMILHFNLKIAKNLKIQEM